MRLPLCGRAVRGSLVLRLALDQRLHEKGPPLPMARSPKSHFRACRQKLPVSDTDSTWS